MSGSPATVTPTREKSTGGMFVVLNVRLHSSQQPTHVDTYYITLQLLFSDKVHIIIITLKKIVLV